MMILRRSWAEQSAAVSKAKENKSRFLLINVRFVESSTQSSGDGATSFLRSKQKLRAERAMPVCPSVYPFVSSESQLQRELNQTRVVDGIVNDAEGGGSIDILLAAAARAAHVELRMVEEVEELRPE